MTKAAQIRQGLNDLAKKVGPLNTILVEVVSVDEDNKTCEVLDDDVSYYDVRLRPVINGKECITIFPTPGTWCLIIKIEDDEAWQVISTDEAYKINVKVDDTVFEMSEGVLIQRGADTLKQVLTMIIESIQQIMVVYGNNPDYAKLIQANTKLQNLLK